MTVHECEWKKECLANRNWVYKMPIWKGRIAWIFFSLAVLVFLVYIWTRPMDFAGALPERLFRTGVIFILTAAAIGLTKLMNDNLY